MTERRTVGDVGEFGLIARLESLLGPSAAVAGIGDDTAVLEIPGDLYLLATVDMLVEGVHFRRGAIGALALGRRALAAGLSDVAAMGGRPTSALVSLALPADTPLAWVEDLYRGLREEGREGGSAVVGGNLARIDGPIVIDVTVLGEVARPDLVLRRGAQIGDVLAVTGVLGEAAATRLWNERGADLVPFVPRPRLSAGRSLAARHLVHAMIDLSDGLAGDVQHLAAASGVGAVIYRENVPVAIRARQAGKALGLDPADLALFGGEDYELLVALPEEALPAAKHAAGEVPLTVIGTVLAPDQGIVQEGEGGTRQPLPAAGWTHF